MKAGPLRFTSIKYRLALLFLSITAGAILVIYFYVVPQLESSLTSEKLDGLEKDAATYSRSLQQAIGSEVNARQLDRLTRQIAERTDAGVTVLGIPQDKLDPSNLGSSPPYVISDSREPTSRLELSSDTALAAARDRRLKTSTRSQEGSQLAQAARPLLNRGEATQVVVFSESLNDVADNVSLIQRQILIAGTIALIVSIIAGYGASNALARRVKRLERAAGQVAAGNFSEPPIPVDSEDELGQLARAFNEMQRRLAGLDRARKEFIANASHELRTPIFSLGGFVELLQDEDIDEHTRAEFLLTMSEQVDRLQKLTTELLDLSRLDAGSLELELEPVPLATIARQVAGEFAAAAARQEASIEIVGEEVEAECDPERVGQVVRALLDNALSHTGHGTSITVTTGRREAAGPPAAVLRVADDGAGIEDHRLPNVFDRFHSGDSGQGSGLGLAIARELTERMLGTLEVSSRPGKTVFTLTLPLAREQPPLPGRRGTSATGRPAEKPAEGRAGGGRKPERTPA